MKPLQSLLVIPHNAALSQPPHVLTSIYRKHGRDLHQMAETLRFIGADEDDVELLLLLPWPYLANRIAVEREKLGLSPVHPFIHFKPSPPPPAWLTPAMIVKIFQLALDGPGDPPPGAEIDEDHEDDQPTGRTLVLPA